MSESLLRCLNNCEEGMLTKRSRVATAYAITKALLPLRLGLSLWLTPSFAKISTLPIKRMFARKAATTPATKVAASPAAGTNAVAGKATK